MFEIKPLNTAIILMLLLLKSCKARKLYFTFKRISRYGFLLCYYSVNYKLLTCHLDRLSNKLHKKFFFRSYTLICIWKFICICSLWKCVMLQLMRFELCGLTRDLLCIVFQCIMLLSRVLKIHIDYLKQSRILESFNVSRHHKFSNIRTAFVLYTHTLGPISR